MNHRKARKRYNDVHDVITENHISGTGYLNHPACTTAQPYVTYRIDTTGSLDPLVILNS